MPTAETVPSTEIIRHSDLLPATLDSSHRCDRCGARAWVAISLPVSRKGLRPLFFCGHHYTQWEPVLRDKAALIHDERTLLIAAVEAQARQLPTTLQN